MSKKLNSISLILFVCALCFTGNAYANLAVVKQSTNVSQQSGKVTSTVKDASGPVTGASVVVKGTTNGTITDLKGNFTLEGVKRGDIIQISFIGYSTLEIPYKGQALGTVNLAEDTQKLDEVVVTALGIKREKKALGYAMQELKGDDLVSARETNVTNALSGKVSGLQIIRSSNGPGSSSKIQLRGSNSVTGLNQPLIVVDGIPMDNFTGANNNDFWNPSADMGNGLSDINPEDIASMGSHGRTTYNKDDEDDQWLHKAGRDLHLQVSCSFANIVWQSIERQADQDHYAEVHCQHVANRQMGRSYLQ